MGKAIIREGDHTSHGGTVLQAFPTLNVYGKNAAGVGHQGYCPQCKTAFTIVAGASNYTFMGKNVAVEGMLTSCGAVLIASQGRATVDNTPGENIVMESSLISHMGADTKVNDDDLEYYFVAEREDGTPVNLTYRIDTEGGKLHEGALGSDGSTVAFPMSKAGEPTFWIPLA